MKNHKKLLLKQVFGKEKKNEIDHKLNNLDQKEHLKNLAKPKDKWKRLKILL